jgi:hypothetical protein
MTVPVDIYLKDRSAYSTPIRGVVVSIVDPQTFMVLATGMTDITGRAAFLLPGSPMGLGTMYEVRFFKLGVLFPNPQKIYVQEPVQTTNKFDMTGTLLLLPAATDPRVCRCTGRFMSLSNRPVVGATVRVMAKVETGFQTPKMVDGNLVSAEALAAQTDGDGFVSLDLIRGAEYYITFSGEDDTLWNIKVPNMPMMNLIDLIHPAPVMLKWNNAVAPTAAVTVVKGQYINVPFTLIYSDFEELAEGSSKWVRFMNSDDTKIEVSYNSGVVSVRGVAPGVANVQAELLPDLKPARVPDYSLSAYPLTVTVTP